MHRPATSDAYIPLNKTIRDFQHALKHAALTGIVDISPAEIIQIVQNQSIYNINQVIQDVVQALSADNPTTNCITGDNTEHVVVTREKLEEIIKIIENGGTKNVSREICS